jgi:CBS domain-containing protein
MAQVALPRVYDVMVAEPVILEPSDPIEHAVTVLVEHDVGDAPVVDAEERLVGHLSRR